MERRSRATTGTTQKENRARSDGAKRRSVGRQTMARTGAKRRSEPGRARVLSCSRHFETMRNFCATLYATPPGFAFVFCGLFPGFRPSRGSTAGLFYSAPPGLKFRLADARKFPHHHPPFNFRFIGRKDDMTVLFLLLQKKDRGHTAMACPRLGKYLSA